VSFKADQNWMKKIEDKLVFPGGGTQFKDGAGQYINFIQRVRHFIHIALYHCCFEVCRLSSLLFTITHILFQFPLGPALGFLSIFFSLAVSSLI
jgi:hypothetical protein